ncbi:MAG: hypothetical protein HYX48_02490 [Chlamydiales bacterium]|nr:hypothetical protein [Chlamydiales bacterium]
MVFTPETKDFGNAFITPAFHWGMDWTADFITPSEQVVDGDGPRFEAVKRGDRTINVPVMQNVEMDCLESLGRRVVGALCFAALAVAGEVELIFRALVAAVLVPVFIAYGLFCDDCDFDTAGAFTMLLFVDAFFAIDAPVRAISGIVQKCLFNVQNEKGLGVTYWDLSICW